LENQELHALFNSYLEKTASPEEVKLLLDHFQIEDQGDQLRDMIILEMQQPLKDENVIGLQEAKAYDRVEKALASRIDKAAPKKPSLWRLPLIRITAAAAILLLIGGYIIWNIRKANTLTAYAAYGKHTNVQLSDNSQIILDAGTNITYPKVFKGNTRTVILNNGEAYFDIKHNAQKPFIVKANGVDITVLGTSFEVTSFAEEKETKVSVTTGKVGIQLADHSQPTLFVLPGQSAIIDNAHNTFRIEKKPVSDIAAWREQRLIFDDQPLSEVMQSLERKYNVHIDIQNKQLLSETVSMRLNNQPLKDVLTAISFANHFNYVIINDQLIVVK